MEVVVIIFLSVIVIILITGIVMIFKRLQGVSQDSSDEKSMLLLQNSMQELTRSSDQKLNEVQKISRDTVERLTKLDETNKQVLNVTGDLRNLQDILQNPKQRGVLGEYYLEETLNNVLPPNSYEMQYQFKDGSIVDAVVKVRDKLIPVDSKFSLENYQRILEEKDAARRTILEKSFKQDLKNRIDETAKYVKPAEGTMDFAFMFIPSEAIYYDLLVNKVGAVKVSTRDLIEYAFRDKKVVIVSPTSFLAYLQTVLQGLRAMQIEESAKEIRANVEKLSRHLQQYHQYHDKVGTQLGTVVNTYNTASNEFKKIDKDVLKISESKRELLESETIEKPKAD